MSKVLVVGGGWSGLSASVWLAAHGYQPILLERAPQLGGRARSISTENFLLDNGQHLFIQGYTALLELCALLKLSLKQLFLRENACWNIFSLHRPKIPLDLQNPVSLFSLCSPKELLSFMHFARALQKNIVPTFRTAKELLCAKQSARLYTFLWEPLCLAIFSTHPNELCAIRFVQTLSHVLSHTHSHLLFAKTDLSQLLPKPAADFIEQKGGTIHLRQGISHLIVDKNICIGVQSQKQTFFAKNILIATPPWVTSTLLAPYAPSLSAQLACFHPTMITTVYVQYDPSLRLEAPLTSLIGSTAQWVFDRGFTGQAGLFAVTITHDPQRPKPSTQADLINTVEQELAHYLGFPKKAQKAKVFCEKRAAFKCTPDLPEISFKTPLERLWLCGDYLHPFYPASIESAVASGKHSAQLLMENA